ncbi:ribonuclease H-like domain-containing protein [Stenotrophomonas sp. ISL-67]|uniref:ribonuclease H-like domain-containing protein n=1 Tax=Stenotrophomonas sp. ISL-67 TaxID=2819171 RepID=UPI001BE7CF05|nr:ribonuclease H-like domain-containing protein [Stenotrophomonas sp. ISL-67]MBT2767219.1 ribonuclease H-like domain-containing protein [Stenotrophomonas sp. ISL-67]
MSLSLDKLRLLRRQAGDATPRPAAGHATPPVPPAPATPVAANDAQARRAAPDSVFAWVDKEIRHKAPGDAAPAPVSPPPPALRRPEVGDLHRLLGLRDRGAAAAARPRVDARDHHVPGEEIAPGLFLIESFLPQAIPLQPLSLAFARREGEAVQPQDLMFFDTETTGLAGGTGTRAFMIGAADWHHDAARGDGLRIRQLLMTTMAAETAMLREFAGWLQPSTVFSSYNGRCYDAPLLKTRYRLARQRCPITPLDHVDLLFPTRRRYRGTWENCRLATIERQLLQIVREDDLPGSEAPAAWLNYLRGGSAVNLRRVAEHNHQDVVTLSLLMVRLVAEEQRERETLALSAAAPFG